VNGKNGRHSGEQNRNEKGQWHHIMQQRNGDTKGGGVLGEFPGEKLRNTMRGRKQKENARVTKHQDGPQGEPLKVRGIPIGGVSTRKAREKRRVSTA